MSWASRVIAVAATGIGLTVFPGADAAQGEPSPLETPRRSPMSVDIAARSVAPGELLVVTIDVEGQPSAVRVSAFDRQTLAFALGDGRWRALVGIDLDQRSGRYLATIEADLPAGTLREMRHLAVQPKSFPTRTLTVDPSFVNPPPSQLARIEQDQAFLRAVYADSSGRRLWHEPFVRPVPGPANGRFGSRSIFNGQRRSPHGGTDLLSPAGTPVRAPNAGRVVCARDLFFTGNTVILDHGLGVFSMLAHLSRIDVREGETVTDGRVVGLVGATGRVTGAHLHWALTVGGARVDPLSVLALVGSGRPSGG